MPFVKLKFPSPSVTNTCPTVPSEILKSKRLVGESVIPYPDSVVGLLFKSGNDPLNNVGELVNAL